MIFDDIFVNILYFLVIRVITMIVDPGSNQNPAENGIAHDSTVFKR